MSGPSDNAARKKSRAPEPTPDRGGDQAAGARRFQGRWFRLFHGDTEDIRQVVMTLQTRTAAADCCHDPLIEECSQL